MRNIKLIIEYDGTNYAGWQIQKIHNSQVTANRLNTIQETVEGVLRKILQEKVKVIASGRTDAGVHAIGQTVNFKTNSRLSAIRIQESLNALLPEDISVKRAREAGSEFNSCRHAKSKLYRYFIFQNKFPCAFTRKHCWHIHYPLDNKLMRRQARRLLGKHDFKSFCASGCGAKTTVRTIKKISIKTIRYPLSAIRYPLLAIDIEADGFLYNMVRNIVGTLVEIGRGRFEKDSIDRILAARDRRLAGPTAPARGLCLIKVNY